MDKRPNKSPMTSIERSGMPSLERPLEEWSPEEKKRVFREAAAEVRFLKSHGWLRPHPDSLKPDQARE